METQPLPCHPGVEGLSEQAAAALLDVFQHLALLRSPGLARWAAAVSDALLARLLWLSTGVRAEFADTEPVPLSALDAAELVGLHEIVAAAGEADQAIREWCTEMGRNITAALEDLQYDQALVNAKVGCIEAEELRIAREARPAPDLRGLPEWSQVSKPPE